MIDSEKSNKIYVDNAATTPMDPIAIEAMVDILKNEYANPSQPYSISKKSKLILEESRKIIAKCINAEPEEIYFTSGGSESDNWVLKGLFKSDSEKNEIITSSIEHHAILNTCKYLEGFNKKIQYIQPNKEGLISPQSLSSKISEKTHLISIMYANNEIGTIQPIEELCKIAHDHNILFHTDAVQAVGHVHIDVKKLQIDFLSASGHKFNGPKGVGFLYIRKGIQLNSLIHGGQQENAHRAGTENIASIKAMAIALKNNCENLEKNQTHIKHLESVFLNTLDDLDIKYHINGAKNHLPGLLSLSFDEETGESLLYRLNLQGAFVSTGSACNSKNTEISHVLKAIGLDSNLALGTIRISIGKYNTLPEIKQLAIILKKTLDQGHNVRI